MRVSRDIDGGGIVATWKIQSGKDTFKVHGGDLFIEAVGRAVNKYLRNNTGFTVHGLRGTVGIPLDDEVSVWIHASTPLSFIYSPTTNGAELEELSESLFEQLEADGRITLTRQSEAS